MRLNDHLLKSLAYIIHFKEHLIDQKKSNLFCFYHDLVPSPLSIYLVSSSLVSLLIVWKAISSRSPRELVLYICTGLISGAFAKPDDSTEG